MNNILNFFLFDFLKIFHNSFPEVKKLVQFLQILLFQLLVPIFALFVNNEICNISIVLFDTFEIFDGLHLVLGSSIDRNGIIEFFDFETFTY